MNLNANPPSTVTVGSRSYPTPQTGISLPAGSYSITFYNNTLQLRAGRQVKLSAGKTTTVYADFTGASPEVHVQ